MGKNYVTPQLLDLSDADAKRVLFEVLAVLAPYIRGQDIAHLTPPERLTLAAEQLEELTGHSQPGRMVRWLAAHAWVFEPPPRRGEIPRVDLSYYKAKMSGQVTTPRREGPKLDFMLNLEPKKVGRKKRVA